MRTGIGFDVHRLEEGLPLWLGGVAIPFEKGLLGHSDADVLLHAICDAMLGAAGLGDIGEHFPDDDPSLRGISSLTLLARVTEMIRQAGFAVINISAVVLAERPRISPFKPQMVSRIAAAANIAGDRVGIQATTTEGLGLVGRGEGIAAMATVLLGADMDEDR